MPTIPVTNAYVANLPCPDKVIQHPQRFFQGRVEIPRMALIKIDLICIQAIETILDFFGKIGTRKSNAA